MKTSAQKASRAKTPFHVGGSGWWSILKRTGGRIAAENVGLVAAGVAFYGLLSLFPAITAFVAIAGLMTDAQDVVETSQLITQTLPEAARDIVVGQMNDVVGTRDDALTVAFLISIAIATYSASRAVENLVVGLNLAFDETDRRGFIKGKLLVIGLTILLIFGLVVSFVIAGAIPAIASWMAPGTYLETLAMIARWPLLFAIGVFGISLLYRLAPDRRGPKWRWITPGAALACAFWVIGSFGFSLYVQSFASYNETFGSLGGVVVLLTWMWLSAFILLMGAVFDAEMEREAVPAGARGKEVKHEGFPPHRDARIDEV